MTQPPPGTGWRSTPPPSSTAPPAPTGWRAPEGAPPPPSNRGPRLRRLGGALLAILGAATLLVWLVLWLAPPAPAVLLLAGGGYEDNLAVAPNSAGREAMARLARLAGSSSPLSWLFGRSGRLRLSGPAMEVKRGGDWARGLDEAREKTVIVFLALHGGADGKGAYLVPHDSDGDEGDRLRLDSVLDRLAQLPAKKHKLLVLDATAQGPNWSQGLVLNEFARALQDLDSKIASVPNLVVLSSSDIDQRSWPTHTARTTLFAKHLIDGLKGAADANRDGRLHGAELFAYVSQRVEADARNLHGAIQRPVLLPTQGGGERAKALSLTFKFEAEEEAPEPAPALPEVKEAWASYHAFPSKEAALACVPRDWALWGAWLVRYEQLRLAGSPRAAEALVKAVEAEARVRAGLRPPLASTYHTLALPALVGEPGLVVARPFAPLERLWRKSPADRQTAWDELQKAGNVGKQRRDLLQAAVDQAAINPARDLAEAAKVVRFLDDPTRPTRPAEAHFLVMLDRDLAAKPMPEALAPLVAQALSLRVEAERAALAVAPAGYAYSERVLPWTRGTIDAADRQRQRGQDLLFTSAPDDWRRAAELLDAARKLYAQARDDAAVVRAAWAARDRTLSEVPLHARWLAGTTYDPPAELMTAATGLFEKARQLEAQLAAGKAERDPVILGKLANLTREAQAALAALEARLDAVAQKCESTAPGTAGDATTVLTLPRLAPARRWALVQKLDRLARRAPAGESGVTVDATTQRERRKRQAARQGQLALASLGRELFDRLGGATGEPFAPTEYRVRNAEIDEQWWVLLRKAGDAIGARLRQLPEQAERRTREARQLGDARLLADAAPYARRLDAGQCQAIVTDAAALDRHARLQHLLSWQAERTWTDHWHGDDPRPESTPYYRIVGLDLLGDARRVEPLGRPVSPGESSVRQKLDQTDTFGFPRTATLHLVAGEHRAVGNALTDRAPAGHPVIWAEPGEKLAFARPTDAARRVAPSLTVTLASPELDRAEQVPPTDARPEETRLTWKAYYRGAVRGQATAVQLHAAAPLTQRDTARPPLAGVAVRASSQLIGRLGEATGALSIVLDCSGSMGPPRGQPAEKGAYHQFTRVLRQALARVPRGTSVSVWAFGQAVPPRMGVQSAEDTIERVVGPVTWKGAAQIDGVLEKVEALTPWNESPITRAMLQARRDLVATTGFRGMLVLTDGVDNRIAADKVGNPEKLPLPDLLKASFQGSRIQVHVVGLETSDRAELAARAPFEALAKQTGGTFATLKEPRAALDGIEKMMRPDLRYRLVDDARDGPRPAYRDVAREDENDRWQTVLADAPSSYQIDLRGGQGPRLPVVLDRGDALLLRLFRDGDRAGAERALYSLDDAFRRRPARQRGEWRAAVLQNQANESALQMLLALDKQPSDTERALRLPRPREVWLELAATGNQAAAPAVRWSEAAGYPTAAYGIDVPAWPRAGKVGAAPALRVWWLPALSGPGLSLKFGTDFRALADLRGKAIEVQGEKVTLDSAAIEQRWVGTDSGTEQRWCWVIRATHAPDRPIRVRPEGPRGLAGEEHRYYPKAGRYVGLFWFTNLNTRDEVAARVVDGIAALHVVSISGVKKEAAEQKHVAEFTDLGMPDSTPRPRAPLRRD